MTLRFSKNITTGIAVAHGRGVILLEAERAGIPAFEYTPMQDAKKQEAMPRGGCPNAQLKEVKQRKGDRSTWMSGMIEVLLEPEAVIGPYENS